MRKTLAISLRCVDRIDWKASTLPRGEEVALVAKWRALYEPFDFAQ